MSLANQDSPFRSTRRQPAREAANEKQAPQSNSGAAGSNFAARMARLSVSHICRDKTVFGGGSLGPPSQGKHFMSTLSGKECDEGGEEEEKNEDSKRSFSGDMMEPKK